jgi:hypothetical protein
MKYPQFYSSADGTRAVMVINNRVMREVKIDVVAVTKEYQFNFRSWNYTPEELQQVRRDLIELDSPESFRKATRFMLMNCYQEIRLAKELFDNVKN